MNRKATMMPVDYNQQVSKNLPLPPIQIDPKYKKRHNLPTERNVLVLATGGTLCMKPNLEGAYEPVPRYIPDVMRTNSNMHDQLYYNQHIYHRRKHEDTFVLPITYPAAMTGHGAGVIRDVQSGIRVVYTIYEYNPLIDSANMSLEHYFKIAADVYNSYNNYDGFVILHGTDTLAYTASTLSFMFENLGKPVILTGAQVPAAEMRSDAFDNILGSIVLAGNFPEIPEVGIFFNRKLFRGNRCVKMDAEAFDAFNSPNCEPLVTMGITITLNTNSIFRENSTTAGKFRVAGHWNRMVGLLRIFPTITATTVRKFIECLDGVVLQTYGAGNGPSERADIMAVLEEASARGCLILNCTQCSVGNVSSIYAAGLELEKRGVIAGHDMTPEAALAKLSYVLGLQNLTIEERRKILKRNLRGEMTPPTTNDDTLESLGENFYRSMIENLTSNLQDHKDIAKAKKHLFSPLLCSAANNNNLHHIKMLIAAGADVNQADYDQRTVLHVAAAEGNVEIVKYLLKQGANVHYKDRSGNTPLAEAIEYCNIEVVHLLIEMGANILTFNLKSKKIANKLCRLAYEDDVDSLEAWIAAQVDLNTCDYDGRTPLIEGVGKFWVGGFEMP